MTRFELGKIGVALTYGDWNALVGAAGELERLGYSAIWVAGGQLDDLARLADVVRATERVPVVTGIIPVDVYSSDAVAAAYAAIGDRFVVGLGGAHGPRPLRTLGEYLDRLDDGPATVPADNRMLAALGPRVLELARERTSGAVTLLVTPDYIADARGRLGTGPLLAVQELVVLDTDPARARAAAREVLGFLAGVGGYRAHFGRIGFTEDDIEQLSDRLVDALVAWGDLDAVSGRISELLAAGADHVAVSVLGADAVPTQQWRELAAALIT